MIRRMMILGSKNPVTSVSYVSYSGNTNDVNNTRIPLSAVYGDLAVVYHNNTNGSAVPDTYTGFTTVYLSNTATLCIGIYVKKVLTGDAGTFLSSNNHCVCLLFRPDSQDWNVSMHGFAGSFKENNTQPTAQNLNSSAVTPDGVFIYLAYALVGSLNITGFTGFTGASNVTYRLSGTDTRGLAGYRLFNLSDTPANLTINFTGGGNTRNLNVLSLRLVTEN